MFRFSLKDTIGTERANKLFRSPLQYYCMNILTDEKINKTMNRQKDRRNEKKRFDTACVLNLGSVLFKTLNWHCNQKSMIYFAVSEFIKKCARITILRFNQPRKFSQIPKP